MSLLASLGRERVPNDNCKKRAARPVWAGGEVNQNPRSFLLMKGGGGEW